MQEPEGYPQVHEHCMRTGGGTHRSALQVYSARPSTSPIRSTPCTLSHHSSPSNPTATAMAGQITNRPGPPSRPLTPGPSVSQPSSLARRAHSPQPATIDFGDPVVEAGGSWHQRHATGIVGSRLGATDPRWPLSPIHRCHPHHLTSPPPPLCLRLASFTAAQRPRFVPWPRTDGRDGGQPAPSAQWVEGIPCPMPYLVQPVGRVHHGGPSPVLVPRPCIDPSPSLTDRCITCVALFPPGSKVPLPPQPIGGGRE